MDDDIKAELRKFITEEYVDFAFDLPLASTTFWQLMKHDIRPAAGESNRFCDLDNLIAFLSDYFSTELVKELSEQLTSLNDSILGSDYAWRKGKDEFACGVIDDIVAKQSRDNGPLKGFFGCVPIEVSSDSEGEGEGEPKPSESSSTPVVAVEPPHEEHFSSIPEVTIDLPAFRLTVLERATLFGRHPRLRHHEVTGPVFDPYDPSPEEGQARLYHGTFRSEWVKGFKTWGIDPIWTAGHEFNNGPAFYTINCPCIAYEQPLHNHPAGLFRQPDDYPAVLEFVVDVKTLCGQRCIPGTEDKFRVLRFDELSDGEWAWFCESNIRFFGDREGLDVVIGPLCKFTGEGVVILNATSGDGSGAPVAQLAFCSTRSRLWMATCLQRVYSEDRKSFGNVV